MNRRLQGQRGFTLIELLVGVALLVLLGLGMAAFAKDLSRQRRLLQSVSEASVIGTTVVDAIERNLMTSLAGDGRFGGGVRGESASIRILSCGVAIEEDAAGSDILETRFAWDASTGELRGAHGSPVHGGVSDEVLSKRVSRLRLRYHDGSNWVDSFDSLESGRLPLAVEVALWFAEDRQTARSAVDSATDSDESLSVTPQEFQALGEPDRLRVIAVPDSMGESGGLSP